MHLFTSVLKLSSKDHSKHIKTIITRVLQSSGFLISGPLKSHQTTTIKNQTFNKHINKDSNLATIQIIKFKMRRNSNTYSSILCLIFLNNFKLSCSICLISFSINTCLSTRPSFMTSTTLFPSPSTTFPSPSLSNKGDLSRSKVSSLSMATHC
ncbi:hypothetical protein Patl1_27368 [Pistacia atlantica]|uniref:Uncharacterized protein n=1 Tax=Pistacia atlantica TaxID=434234 RepID=A0ACC1BGM8_9ROSI|nr:hypothetical protein Patl1_27368 [Pistacia atlantica]